MDHTRTSTGFSRGSNWIRAAAVILIAGGLSISLVGAACRSSATGSGNTFAAQPLGAVGDAAATSVVVLAVASIALGLLILQLTARFDGRVPNDA